VGAFLGEGIHQLPKTARDGFRRFAHDLKSKDMPPLPVETATASQLKTDTFSLAAYGKPYGPEVVRFLDLYARSALGGGAEEVGAYWGLDFLAAEADAKYTMPGGNAGYAEALARAVGPARIKLGATVIQVKPVGDRVHVTYVHGQELVTVDAGVALMCCAKHIARRAVAGLPAAQADAMAQVRYEPYLVVNVLAKGGWRREAFDTWVPGAPFTDVAVADWVNPDRRRRDVVLTAYCPQGFGDRYKLLDDAYPTQVGRAVVAGLDRLQPGFRGHVQEVRVFRWGHPMVCSGIGAITKLRPLVTRPFGRVLFAAGDNQMTATIEAAVWEGRKHADLAKKLLASRTHT
jgi:monoamine oxidase